MSRATLGVRGSAKVSTTAVFALCCSVECLLLQFSFSEHLIRIQEQKEIVGKSLALKSEG